MMNKDEKESVEAPLTLPAEWAPVEAVLVAWPHSDTDWNYMLPEVRECYRNICRAIALRAQLIIIGPQEALESAAEILDVDTIGNSHFVELPTNDTWTRDYGALTVLDNEGKPRALDLGFNAWGLKFASNHDNLATARLDKAGLFLRGSVNHRRFILEGGSIESDGHGTILTTARCLLEPNRNPGMDKKAIEEELKRVIGARTVLWLEHGYLEGDDTDSHVDTLARLLPPGDVIVYTGCSDSSDPHYKELQAMAQELRSFVCPLTGKPYHLLELPLPDPVLDPEDGSRLPATYANFLILNGAVLLPVYNQPLKDLQAVQTIAAALPEYEIIPLDCRALVRQHGSLHCATIQFPRGTVNLKLNQL